MRTQNTFFRKRMSTGTSDRNRRVINGLVNERRCDSANRKCNASLIDCTLRAECFSSRSADAICRRVSSIALYSRESFDFEACFSPRSRVDGRRRRAAGVRRRVHGFTWERHRTCAHTECRLCPPSPPTFAPGHLFPGNHHRGHLLPVPDLTPNLTSL